jgi:ketosteroid isomerase-like protein
MKTKTFFLLFLSVLLIVSCAPKNTAVVNKDQVLADSLLQINENAWNSADAQRIADMYTDDCLVYNNGKPVWSKDSALVFAKSVVPFIKNFKTTLGPTTVTPDKVFMEKYWTLDWIVEGKTMITRGVSILIWVKQPDNSWKTAMEKSDYSIKTY